MIGFNKGAGSVSLPDDLISHWRYSGCPAAPRVEVKDPGSIPLAKETPECLLLESEYAANAPQVSCAKI